MTQKKNINTKERQPIISFHPLIEGDLHLWVFTALDEELLDLLAKAKAVIFPQVVPQELYYLCRDLGMRVFPNYDLRFKYPGKIGQILLFKGLGLPHPKTICFPKIAALGEHPGAKRVEWPGFPFVLKGNHGHEGREIFLIEKETDLEEALKIFKQSEQAGRFGFLAQEFIPSPYDLRVIVCGKRLIPVWRALEDSFKSNLAQGGRLISCPDQALEEKALALAQILVQKGRLNLAAIDFLIKDQNPLLNEINYVFGRRALGGSDSFYTLWEEAVREFIESL